MKPPNPKPSDAFPSLSPGTREAFPNLALTIRGFCGELQAWLLPPRGTCTGRSGCWPLPMAGALSSSLSSKATSSRTPSLATMLKGWPPSPGEPPSHTGPSVHGCWPTSPPLLFADGLSACCDRSPPTGWQPAARWGWDLVRGLGDPLAQHAAQRVGGKQAGPKWVEEGGLEKCLDPGTSVSTPGPR